MKLLKPLALVALYAAVAVAMTWPLCRHLATALPVGCERVATVPLLNAWTIWWNADRAAHGFEHYWDAPIFVPTPTTFAFSEAQPTTLVVAPVVWGTGNAALAYNLYLLATLTLNGWCADRLLRRVGLCGWAALCGGAMTQLLPFVCWQLGVLQLNVLWGVLWTTHAAWSFAESPGWGKAAMLGVAYGVTYAACNYYGLFLAALLGPAGLWMLRYRRIVGWDESASPTADERNDGGTRRLVPPYATWLLQVAVAATVAAALVSPIVVVQRRVAKEHAWQREWNQIRELSAHLRDYTDTPWRQWLDALEDNTPPRADRWPLGPGWLKLFAAGIGLVCGVAPPSLRRWTLAAATIGTLALCLSLGPWFELWNLAPYRFLFDHVPGFAQIRSPFRFAVFVQLACVWLAANVVHALCPRHWCGITLFSRDAEGSALRERRIDSDRFPPQSLRVAAQRKALIAVRWLPALALGGCLIAETLPRPACNGFLRELPPQSELPPWVEFLRDETPADAAVACLPFVIGADVGDYEGTAWWMWWGTFHHRRLLNGYSGYFPDSFVTLKGKLASFPHDGAAELITMGATHVVVERRAWTPEKLRRHPNTSRWIWRFGDDVAGIDVYEIPRAE